MQKTPAMVHAPIGQLSVKGDELARLQPVQLREGALLVARVLSGSAKGVARIQIGGRSLPARTQTELKRGEMVNLKVVKVRQKLQLQIVLPAEIAASAKRESYQVVRSLPASSPSSPAPVAPSTPMQADQLTAVIKILSLNPKIELGIGAPLEARVISNSKAGFVRLQIGKTTVEGATTAPFEAGQKISVQLAGDRLHPQLLVISPEANRRVNPSIPISAPKSDPAFIRPLLSNPLPESLPLQLQGLKKGEVVQASVVANHTKGQLSLKIGGTVIEVTTTLRPVKEQPLYLSVVKGGQSPVLEQLSSKQFTRQLTLNAYRQMLPRQQNLVSGLQKLLDAGQPQAKDIPATIKASVAKLMQQLPTPEKLAVATGVRQTLSDSGLFSETKLVAGMPLRADLKAGLAQIITLIKAHSGDQSKEGQKEGQKEVHRDLSTESRSVVGASMRPDPKTEMAQLASLVRASLSHEPRQGQSELSAARGASTVAQPSSQSAPSGILDELVRSSDSAVARIQIQQLASLPQDDSGQQGWHFELPILNGDRLERLNVMIKRGKGSAENEVATPWSITLQMNLSPLGSMRVQLNLHEQKISTTFWAEEPHTLSLLNQNIPTLKSAFERAGLEVDGLRVLHGAIKPEEEKIPDNLNDLSLLNVRV